MPTNLYGPRDNYHPTHSHVMASLIRKFCEAKKAGKKIVTCWGTGTRLENLCMLMISVNQLFSL